MKVLAVNSSPRSDKKSMTVLMLNKLLEGMKSSNAEIEKIDLRKMNIKYCTGCYSCWTKTPGNCVLKDDMSNEIYSKFKNADIAVFATPLYCHHMNAIMSTFQERLLPVALPFVEKRDEDTRHPARFELPKMVWLSVCGFPNISEFDMLSKYIKSSFGKYLIAEIYRCGAEFLTNIDYSNQTEEIFEATKLAGKELVENKKVSEETLNKITQHFESYEKLSNRINKHWEDSIEENKKEGFN